MINILTAYNINVKLQQAPLYLIYNHYPAFTPVCHIIGDIMVQHLLRLLSIICLVLGVYTIMSGFFGFDTALPERRDGTQGGSKFQSSSTNDTFALSGIGAGEEEDLAVYTWGENYDDGLLDGGDTFNDETFGDAGPVGKAISWLVECWALNRWFRPRFFFLRATSP